MSVLAPTREVKEAEVGSALDYLSASRLSCWQQCRRKHYFRYVRKLPSKDTPAMLLGRVVHAVLQEVNHARWSGDVDWENIWQSSFDGIWEGELAQTQVRWKNDSEEAQTKAKARELVQAYLQSDESKLESRIAGVEVTLESPLQGYPPLVGILDLVDADGRIIDYKTAAQTPNEESASHQHGTQLAFYALLYRLCSGRTEKALELHHLIKTKEPKVRVTKIPPLPHSRIKELLDLMKKHVAAVKAGDYTSSPSFLCAGCDYLAECRAWKGGKR